MSELLIKETQLHRIIRKTGRKPCECKCSLCKMQCHTPCLGTPQDIENLIDAGYANKLAPTLWGAGMIMRVIDIPIPMIQAIASDEYCAFFHNGLCELHDKGLKPTEGRLSHHSTRIDNFKASKSIAWNVAKEWLSEENAEVIERVADKYSRILKRV
ncbi:hypothetical protein [Parabacteroides pacaensis]|uniref:hypothetical protein n=1 Tax=Parabacteroides pacaensis TaxID=2086575 RepID=UPI000D10AEC0|nr:hypothetical protein [Parabacteroides pacaensis]